MLKNSIRQKSFRKIKNLKRCQECGSSDKKLVRHHNNYNDPLDIKILCDVCHKEWHKKHKAIEAINYKKEKAGTIKSWFKDKIIKSLKVKVYEETLTRYKMVLAGRQRTVQQDLEEYIQRTINQ